MAVCMDDIVVYEKDSAKHSAILKEIALRFQVNSLIASLEKCLFMVPEIEFVTHW